MLNGFVTDHVNLVQAVGMAYKCVRCVCACCGHVIQMCTLCVCLLWA